MEGVQGKGWRPPSLARFHEASRCTDRSCGIIASPSHRRGRRLSLTAVAYHRADRRRRPERYRGAVHRAGTRGQLNQNVIVENRTGAGGVVGTEMAANAPAGRLHAAAEHRGHLHGHSGCKKVNYDVDKDFIPLGQIWSAPQALVVHTDSRFKTVSDLVAEAKAHPGKVTFGSAGDRHDHASVDRASAAGRRHPGRPTCPIAAPACRSPT